MNEAIIVLDGLTKKYGEHTAVDRLSLTINKGEVFGLLGPNGAGKSTTILMMLGLSEPTAGTVHVCGINSTRQPIHVKRRVGYLPDDVGFYEDRTGLENLVYTASLNRIPRKEAVEKAKQLLHKVGLSHAIDQRVGTYSRGMRQRLGLADVLIKEPEVIVLDEPTLGIDPKGVTELLELIRHLSDNEGITVLLSSHQLHQVQQICDRVGLFVKGRLLALGDVESLSEQLFADEPTIITLKADPLTDTLIKAIEQIEGVKHTEREGDRLKITCTTDISPQLAEMVISNRSSLYELHKKTYGLDEIYHRYFEGGENVGEQ